ncbi:MAG: hypothetical protein M1608_08935 [Candidatus Omnitrophica bacterium]|nr:hypothetical protein [Candidatus Omnitrophota bacterium]
MKRAKTWFVFGLGFWLVGSTLVIGLLNLPNKTKRAVVGMGCGLILFWILLGGGLMYRFRDVIRRRVLGLRLSWRLTFILFATVLALIEEAITTTMTNLAPWFGVAVGQAYITASANYLDVVAFHSVVLFLPMFIAWAYLLIRYDFSAFEAFLLFGITGTLAESHRLQDLLGFGLWIFVYGLMVYLPAYSVPQRPRAVAPRWWHYPLAVLLPFLFLLLIPTGLVVNWLFPGHPGIHFPPIR